MSNTTDAVNVVQRIGCARVDDVAAHLPHLTRKQVMNALQNATQRGRLTCRIGGPAGGTYRLKLAPTSVWAYAQARSAP